MSRIPPTWDSRVVRWYPFRGGPGPVVRPRLNRVSSPSSLNKKSFDNRFHRLSYIFLRLFLPFLDTRGNSVGGCSSRRYSAFSVRVLTRAPNRKRPLLTASSLSLLNINFKLRCFSRAKTLDPIEFHSLQVKVYDFIAACQEFFSPVIRIPAIRPF